MHADFRIQRKSPTDYTQNEIVELFGGFQKESALDGSGGNLEGCVGKFYKSKGSGHEDK